MTISKHVKLRVVVANDNQSFLEKMVSILESEFEVVKTARDGNAALEHIIALQPNVVILDLEMPGRNAIVITGELMKYSPNTAVVICSLENDLEVVGAVLQAGALGFVFKANVARDLRSAIKSVAHGRSFVSIE